MHAHPGALVAFSICRAPAGHPRAGAGPRRLRPGGLRALCVPGQRTAGPEYRRDLRRGRGLRDAGEPRRGHRRAGLEGRVSTVRNARVRRADAGEGGDPGRDPPAAGGPAGRARAAGAGGTGARRAVEPREGAAHADLPVRPPRLRAAAAHQHRGLIFRAAGPGPVSDHAAAARPAGTGAAGGGADHRRRLRAGPAAEPHGAAPRRHLPAPSRGRRDRQRPAGARQRLLHDRGGVQHAHDSRELRRAPGGAEAAACLRGGGGGVDRGGGVAGRPPRGADRKRGRAGGGPRRAECLRPPGGAGGDRGGAGAQPPARPGGADVGRGHRRAAAGVRPEYSARVGETAVPGGGAWQARPPRQRCCAWELELESRSPPDEEFDDDGDGEEGAGAE